MSRIIHNYTVIWRPACEGAFRFDHISILLADDNNTPIDQDMIMRFAAQEYVGDSTGVMPDNIDMPEVRAVLDETYDLVAIIEGLQRDISSS